MPHRVWIGDAKAPENSSLEGFHHAGVMIVLVIMTLGMQGPVDDEVGQMVAKALALLFCFLLHHRQANDDVGLEGLAPIGKREDIGGVILAPPVLIQGTPLGAHHQPQREAGV
jgi:hypothetical protein